MPADGGPVAAFTGNLPIAARERWNITGCLTLPSGDTWYSTENSDGVLAMIGPSGSHRVVAEGHFDYSALSLVEGTEQILAVKSWHEDEPIYTLILAEGGEAVATVPLPSIVTSAQVVQADQDRILLRVEYPADSVLPRGDRHAKAPKTRTLDLRSYRPKKQATACYEVRP